MSYPLSMASLLPLATSPIAHELYECPICHEGHSARLIEGHVEQCALDNGVELTSI